MLQQRVLPPDDAVALKGGINRWHQGA